MTDIVEATHTCGHCGHDQQVSVVLSSCGWGACDLDGRPPEETRSLLNLACTCCDACGYCADDLQAPTTAAMTACMAAPAYRAALCDPAVPEGARHFNCASLLLQAEGRLSDASVALLSAAWTCDDAVQLTFLATNYPKVHEPPAVKGDAFIGSRLLETDATRPDLTLQERALVLRMQSGVSQARHFRARAAALWELAGGGAQPAAQDPRCGPLILTDLLRRSGQFSRSAALAVRTLQSPSPTHWDDSVGDALRWELLCAKAHDADAYTFADVQRAIPDWDQLALRREARDRELAAKQAAAELARLERLKPRELGGPLRLLVCDLAANDRAGVRAPAMQTLRRLPLPELVAVDLARMSSAGGWPALATVCAIGLAVQRILPDMPAMDATTHRLCVRHCTGFEAIVDYVSYCLRRSQPDSWHYWPPAGPGDGPGAPDYR
jgi:hypothetical protein